jgi:hypothetical protein
MTATDGTSPPSGELKIAVATHGHCFDGMCSAAMFTRLMEHLHPRRSLAFSYHGCGYGPTQSGVDPALLVGDINAVLDFRFSAAPQLTWYFDHHVSAFSTPQERAAYDQRVASQSEADRTFFHDGAYGSCTKLIADLGAARFGLDLAQTRELVTWADMIDRAAFPSAKMAVERTDPVLQFMTVVEHMADDAFLARMVPRLLRESLPALAQSPDVQAAYAPLRQSHDAFVRLVEEKSRTTGAVVFTDLSDQLLEVAGKFVTYALYPESAYSVLLTRSKSKCKISIGYNPWSPLPRTHNIAAICERYGGGGHPVVGAISLAADKVPDAKLVCEAIVSELST